MDQRRYRVVASTAMLEPARTRLFTSCEVRERSSASSKSEWDAWRAEAEGWFAGNEPVNEAVLAEMPNLRVVTKSAVGYDNIDVAACTKRGIRIGYTPGVLVNATADLTWGLILDAARRISAGWDYVRAGAWGQGGIPFAFGMDLFDKKLGVIGMGAIGSAVARRARVSGMHILYANRTASPHAEELNARHVHMDELLSESDFVLLLLPLNSETRGLIGRRELRLMKPSAFLINAARGPVVDTDALVEALQTGEIAFAVLDVTDPEPMPREHPLVQLPNVLITPHIGSATRETRTAMAELAVDNLLAGLAGEPMRRCVNPEALRRS